ncbi:MFS family permease [Streptomonospora nanhaiensis]|uniref:MFS family permease n=1 Tax=Streptomonospora nanhaiensis TaxID=1323731 RepID=A0A853BL13_9ACTN|nr:MFS transporter [Streptomonospora nanhaiensis]NYI95246.1 MFS family permease [Streptomonospora nanhaiensis]
MVFAMFLAAIGAQTALQRLPRRAVLLLGAAGTAASMLALVAAVHTSSAALLAASALLAGAGQGLGQLGGLSLLNSALPPRRLAEANAAFNVGGYVPAGLLPVLTGYLSDHAGLTAATTAFGAVLLTLAATGATVVATGRRRVHGPA